MNDNGVMIRILTRFMIDVCPSLYLKLPSVAIFLNNRKTTYAGAPSSSIDAPNLLLLLFGNGGIGYGHVHARKPVVNKLHSVNILATYV